jgi:hypothetical protein
MRAALDLTMAEQELDPSWEQELWRYLVGAAIAMVNAAPTESPAQSTTGITLNQENQ